MVDSGVSGKVPKIDLPQEHLVGGPLTRYIAEESV